MNQSNNAPNKYLFYVTLSYSFSILRPIAEEVIKRSGDVAWFIPQGAEAEDFLKPNDKRLNTVKEVIAFAADAVLAPGNYLPDFFPGIKVQVFHGFDSGKKNKFNVRGFFDLYCTQGPNITNAFNQIQDGTYDVVETGWSKLDALFTPHKDTPKFTSKRPIIFYAPTFSPKLTSTYELFPHIKAISESTDWQWIVKLHPKATQQEIEMFKSIQSDKLQFVETSEIIPLLQAADVLVSDTSSILAEFALQQKAVVAFKNRRPEDWMINFDDPDKLKDKIASALAIDDSQLEKIKQHCNSIHPYRDGQSSTRVVDAIDQRIAAGMSHLKPKPLNLIRRLKMRKKLKYYRW